MDEGFLYFGERESFDHGTNTGAFGERQRVFGVGRHAGSLALNGFGAADDGTPMCPARRLGSAALLELGLPSGLNTTATLNFRRRALEVVFEPLGSVESDAN